MHKNISNTCQSGHVKNLKFKSTGSKKFSNLLFLKQKRSHIKKEKKNQPMTVIICVSASKYVIKRAVKESMKYFDKLFLQFTLLLSKIWQIVYYSALMFVYHKMPGSIATNRL